MVARRLRRINQEFEQPRRAFEFLSSQLSRNLSDGPTNSSGLGPVADVQDFDFLITGWGGERGDVTVAFFQQGARDRGNPAHLPALGVDFVDADDLDRALLAAAVDVRIR